MRQIESELREDPFRCGLTGIVGVLALFTLSLILAITSLVLIGIPFLVGLWIAICVGMVMGITAVASTIGLRLPFLRGRKTQALVLAVGLLIMLLVAKIPVLGPLAMTGVSLVALGALIRTRFGGGRRQGLPERIEAPVGA